MAKYNDISGKIFNDLTVLHINENYKTYPQKWVCECKCGNRFSALSHSITSGKTKNCKACSAKRNQKATDDELLTSYNEFGNIWKVAEKHGMCGQSVHERLCKLGVNLNNNQFTDDDILYLKNNYEYFASRGRLDELSKDMGRTKQLICRKAKMLGLNTSYNRKKKLFDDFDNRFKRPDMYKNRNHPKGMLGKKHKPETIELLQKISKENQKKISENEEKRAEIVKKMIHTKLKKGNLVNPRIKETWKSGWREIGGKIKYFRSRWEANYARYLQHLKEQNQILEWEHESKVFYFDDIKKGCVSFLPDFEVTDVSGSLVYHEVKGWMDDRSKIKIERMGVYFPNVTLKVIDSKWFKENNRKLGLIISEWEA